MHKSNLSIKEGEQLSKALEVILNNQTPCGQWISNSFVLKKNNFFQIQELSKWMIMLAYIEKLSSEEIEVLGKTLATLELCKKDLVETSLKVRAFALSAFKVMEMKEKYPHHFSFSSDTRLQKLSQIACYGKLAKGLIDQTRTAKIWHSRTLVFHTKDGTYITDPRKRADTFVQLAYDALGEHYFHVGMVRQKSENPHYFHIGIKGLEQRLVKEREYLLSDVFELSCEKLLTHEFLAAIEKPQMFVESLNQQLEKIITQIQEGHKSLELKNKTWAIIRVLPLRLYGARSNFDKGCLLKREQMTNCCHYAASVIHLAVEKLNTKLLKKYGKSFAGRCLHRVFPENIHPSALLISDLRKYLKPYCHHSMSGHL